MADYLSGPEELPRARAYIQARIKQAESGCWTWQLQPEPYGYGQASWGGKTRRAHRLVYEVFVGSIPDGLTLDHLCRNRICVNPEHLEPVDSVTNAMRGYGPTAVNARKDRCVNGHKLTPENVHIKPSRPNSRNCRECERVASREYQRRLRAAAKEAA